MRILFSVKTNNTSIAGNFNKSVFWIRTQGRDPFFSHVSLSPSLHLPTYYILLVFVLAVSPVHKRCHFVSANAIAVTAKIEGKRMAELSALCSEFITGLGHVKEISLQNFN